VVGGDFVGWLGVGEGVHYCVLLWIYKIVFGLQNFFLFDVHTILTPRFGIVSVRVSVCVSGEI
jgi:hypothetical protein